MNGNIDVKERMDLGSGLEHLVLEFDYKSERYDFGFYTDKDSGELELVNINGIRLDKEKNEWEEVELRDHEVKEINKMVNTELGYPKVG